MGGEEDIKNISDFELTVGTKDKKIIYSGCEWLEINRNIGLDAYAYESVKISATHRREIKC